MYESNHGRFTLVARSWLQVLAYLALPILLVGLGVVLPLVHPITPSAAAVATTAAITAAR